MATTDKYRKALAEKLDRDLDAFIEKQRLKTEKRRIENPEPEQTLDELVAVSTGFSISNRRVI